MPWAVRAEPYSENVVLCQARPSSIRLGSSLRTGNSLADSDSNTSNRFAAVPVEHTSEAVLAQLPEVADNKDVPMWIPLLCLRLPKATKSNQELHAYALRHSMIMD